MASFEQLAAALEACQDHSWRSIERDPELRCQELQNFNLSMTKVEQCRTAVRSIPTVVNGWKQLETNFESAARFAIEKGSRGQADESAVRQSVYEMIAWELWNLVQQANPNVALTSIAYGWSLNHHVKAVEQERSSAKAADLESILSESDFTELTRETNKVVKRVVNDPMKSSAGPNEGEQMAVVMKISSEILHNLRNAAAVHKWGQLEDDPIKKALASTMEWAKYLLELS